MQYLFILILSRKHYVHMIFLCKHYVHNVQVIINALVTEKNPQVLERANLTKC